MLVPTALILLLLRAAEVSTPDTVDGGRGSLDVEAGRVELRDREQRSIFTGGVTARQGTMRIKADLAIVSYRGHLLGGAGGPTLRRLFGSGGVELLRSGRTASGDHCIYDVEAGLIVILGNVRLRDARGSATGDRLTIRLDDDRATLSASSRGGATSARSGSATAGRVEGTIYGR